MTLRANMLSLSLQIFTFYFVSPRNSFTLIFVLILLIFLLDNDVKRTSKRRPIFKLLTKMVLTFLDVFFCLF